MATKSPTGSLSSKQASTAVRAAAVNPHIAPLLTGRRRPALVAAVHASRAIEKGPRAVVGVHDHRAGGTILAEVDLKSGQVVTVDRSRAVLQLSEDERKEANRLAESDKRVKAFTGKGKMNPLTRLYFPPARTRTSPRGADPARLMHRYAIVFVRPAQGRRAYAVVDLTDGVVSQFLSRADLTGDMSDADQG